MTSAQIAILIPLFNIAQQQLSLKQMTSSIEQPFIATPAHSRILLMNTHSSSWEYPTHEPPSHFLSDSLSDYSNVSISYICIRRAYKGCCNYRLFTILAVLFIIIEIVIFFHSPIVALIGLFCVGLPICLVICCVSACTSNSTTILCVDTTRKMIALLNYDSDGEICEMPMEMKMEEVQSFEVIEEVGNSDTSSYSVLSIHFKDCEVKKLITGNSKDQRLYELAAFLNSAIQPKRDQLHVITIISSQLWLSLVKVVQQHCVRFMNAS
eukprot:TRINITY_DN2442_c0_g1_i1.p1 TRINITY_DN2442_c0_g1~~TRINITY_DN2442_c0_g1_i1.p1  ORF type:complete len:295 (+),score=-16.08 TRINITY_DN2442_c0_g1_i1:85-885(+)